MYLSFEGGCSHLVEMVAKEEEGLVTWAEFQEEMVQQFGADELDDPVAALANLTSNKSTLYQSIRNLYLNLHTRLMHPRRT